jgi:hypothetical protein
VDTPTSSSISKSGPKPKASQEYVEQLEERIKQLESVEPVKTQDGAPSESKRIANLEQLVIRMAHNAGVSHTIIINAGLLPYNPTKSDMSKFEKVG